MSSFFSSSSNRKVAYNKSDDAGASREERMNRLKFELREHIRFLAGQKLNSKEADWDSTEIKITFTASTHTLPYVLIVYCICRLWDPLHRLAAYGWELTPSQTRHRFEHPWIHRTPIIYFTHVIFFVSVALFTDCQCCFHGDSLAPIGW